MGTSVHKRVTLVLRAAVLVLLMSAAAPASAEASFWCWLFGSDCKGGGGSSPTRQSPSQAAPEIDPSGLAGALALAAGGAAMLSDRLQGRRRR